MACSRAWRAPQREARWPERPASAPVTMDHGAWRSSVGVAAVVTVAPQAQHQAPGVPDQPDQVPLVRLVRALVDPVVHVCLRATEAVLDGLQDVGATGHRGRQDPRVGQGSWRRGLGPRLADAAGPGQCGAASSPRHMLLLPQCGTDWAPPGRRPCVIPADRAGALGLRWSQQRLGGDAGSVGALAADELPRHHAHSLPGGKQSAGGDLPSWSHAQHHCVMPVGHLRSHPVPGGGSSLRSVPPLSAPTMPSPPGGRPPDQGAAVATARGRARRGDARG